MMEDTKLQNKDFYNSYTNLPIFKFIIKNIKHNNDNEIKLIFIGPRNNIIKEQ